jgi:hypothetical protein
MVCLGPVGDIDRQDGEDGDVHEEEGLGRHEKVREGD